MNFGPVFTQGTKNLKIFGTAYLVPESSLCYEIRHDDRSGRALGLPTITVNFVQCFSPGAKNLKILVAVISCAHRRRVMKFGRVIDLGVC